MAVENTIEHDPKPDPLPPIHLAIVRTSGDSTWRREEIYGDDGR
jgi:hypothetical protein